MIAFRLTMVRMPSGRVSSAQAFIMPSGPMAMTSSMSGCSCRTWSSTTVTKPLVPNEPSSVATCVSSECRSNRSSQNIWSFDRKPTIEIVREPSSLCLRSCGKTGATPSPPPTTTTEPRRSSREATPSGPMKSRRNWPSTSSIIW